VEVREPNIYTGRNPLDFGRGFYLTTSFTQAENWARRKTVRIDKGHPTVSVYDFPDTITEQENLTVKQFFKADAEWLNFVVANRNEENMHEKYDIVIGPVADDSVIRLIRMYINGMYDEKEVLKRFKTEILDNQILIASERALRLLVFKEARKI
jgi:hypothetical protein